MVKNKSVLTKSYEKNKDGNIKMSFFDLSEFNGISEKIKQFSLVELIPGEEVGYHTHIGDSENYYIISGKGLYNDNGETVEVGKETITFTPSGSGHALKNTGDKVLKFIALVIKND